jgi:hypothetical protein
VSAPDRAAWIAAVRKVLDILEADPLLPLPFVNLGQVRWTLYGDRATPQKLAALEKALPCEFTGGMSVSTRDFYELRGEIGGVGIVIEAWAEFVAKRTVTGTRTVEDVEWVRLPAEPESGERA